MFYHRLAIPKKSINKVPKGNLDEKFDIRSSEYQNYLIARDHNPLLGKNSFTLLEIMTRSDATGETN